VNKAPAQTFARLIGWILTIAGIVGFFYCASFEAGKHLPSEDVFGILSVNGWHNLVHLVTGLIGLRAARTWGGARTYSFALFVLYTAIFVLGLAYGTSDAVLSLVPVNGADDALHGIIAAAALLSGLATPAVPPPTLAAEPAAG
jgi:hypothetical protein